MGETSAKPDDRLLTIEEFARLPEDDRYTFELVRGRVVREPRPAPRHGRMAIKLGRRVDEFAERHGLGLTFTETGFALYRDPDTLRGPDISFVSSGRVPASGYTGTFWPIAPDLAVEILSPLDRPKAIHEKVTEYLDVGSRLVWVVDPDREIVTVYRHGVEAERLGSGDVLGGADVLPGFALPLAKLFGTP